MAGSRSARSSSVSNCAWAASTSLRSTFRDFLGVLVTVVFYEDGGMSTSILSCTEGIYLRINAIRLGLDSDDLVWKRKLRRTVACYLLNMSKVRLDPTLKSKKAHQQYDKK